ncbi:hypothetical protein POSPLADRAFT_1175262 [Postia placenta MAD-698-R-SB12]|uniref:PPPDE domain-containing protein n=1 Tax=Postia placenta MAD-698-R-SB12 TaxID=670580 RepID=A0A1X6MJQ9_9APHY|nr:hypothetical protein POSPLADRAFT_1175262 [Postia placenta MAD-698-R-SB12]OSX56549.1 hypothetical protein POSPLADRAFT_1175262 [Postia placenta MAD-698-R-SB12]
MSAKVALYVYDLSNGLAKQLSRQLTGRQIDGVWHTSVVVFGREIFYGQGICETLPAQSHHGKPLQMVEMGETAIDEDTFDEYLNEMRQQYTADKYHLLDFNCNSFTNDVIGFLTGGSIPSWIKDLPSDFLSTPFGAALRPTIDNMFRRPVPGAAPTPATLQPSPAAASAAISASPNPALAASLLQAMASQAMSPSAMPSPQATQAASASTSTATVSAPIHICTNSASLDSLMRSHRAVAVFFTSATCGPCRMIEPIFEDLAHAKTHGMGNQVGSQWGVRVTPTFMFFLDGKKVHEFKGANAAELRSQVDLLLYQAFPPHPHTKLALPAVEALSTNPILFQQVPAVDNVMAKLSSFIDASLSSPEPAAAKEKLAPSFPGYLRMRFPPPGSGAKAPPNLSASAQMTLRWAEATRTLASTLPPMQLFPLVDLWRLALLDEPISSWCSTALPLLNPVHIFTDKANAALSDSPKDARNFVLVVLRLLANTFASPALARGLLAPAGKRADLTRVLVSSLLYADTAVRTAAASLAFNVAAFLQKSRVDQLVGKGVSGGGGAEEDGDWEVELVSAVLEAFSNEMQSEEVVHRLTAALAFLLRLSPVYETQLTPFLEVLQARETLKAKLTKSGFGEGGVQKKEVRGLIEQVADKLCP